MRTTISISDQLYRAAKARAALTSQSVSEVIEDAVREALRPKPPVTGAKNALPVYGGDGVLPGVDLANSEAILEEMNSEVAIDALR